MAEPHDPIVLYKLPDFDPYALALGRAIFAWNDLQETLGLLFCRALGDLFSDAYMDIWRACTNDRAQREMLLAANSHISAAVDPKGKLKRVIKWICDEATELEDLRNNITHAPIVLQFGTESANGRVMPASALRNKRAIKLARAGDLLASYNRLGVSASLLGLYATDLFFIDASSPDSSWPDKPHLPKNQHPNPP